MVERELLKERIRIEEGWRPFVYDDANGRAIKPATVVIGHPTIGYGFALDVAALPKTIAEAWLDHNVNELLGDLSKHCPCWLALDPIRQQALAEMAYQMGVTGVLEFKHMLGAMAERRWKEAAAAGRNSLWYRQTPARAERVLKMIETGIAER